MGKTRAEPTPVARRLSEVTVDLAGWANDRDEDRPRPIVDLEDDTVISDPGNTRTRYPHQRLGISPVRLAGDLVDANQDASTGAWIESA